MKKFLSIILAVISIFSCFSIIAGAEETAERDFSQGDIVLFGSYPKSSVEDASLIKKLNKTVYNLGYRDNDYEGFKCCVWGRYLDVELEGEWYRGIFINDIFTKTWFRFEPIEWIVLNPFEGYVIARYAIDIYFNGYLNGVYCGNYEYLKNNINEDIKGVDFIETKCYEFKNYTFHTSENKSATDIYKYYYSKNVKDSYSTIEKFSSISLDKFITYRDVLENNNDIYNENNSYIYSSLSLKEGFFYKEGRIEFTTASYLGISGSVTPAINSRYEFLLLSSSAIIKINNDNNTCAYLGYEYSSNPDNIQRSYIGVRPVATVDLSSSEVICKHNEEKTGETITKESTCSSTGIKTITYTCSICGETRAEGSEIEKKEHNIQKTTIAPSCTKQGYDEYKCSNCDYSYADNYTNPIKHTFILTETVNPTCAEKGYSLFECSNCDESYKEFIDTIEHSYDKLVETKEPTCTETGHYVYECKCGAKGKEEIPMIDHAYTYTTTGATCVTAGYREGKCSCGKTIIDGTIPATGIHTYELTTTTPSTYYNTGKHIYTCKDCNKIKEETIDMLSCFIGDVDNDNAITVADARLSLRAAIKLDSPEQASREYRACDYDGDNNITVNDARKCLRMAINVE